MLNHSSRGTSTPHKCTTQSQVLMRLLICLHSIRQSQEICEHTKTKWSRINFIQNVSLIRKVPFQRHVTQVISSLRNTGPKKKTVATGLLPLIWKDFSVQMMENWKSIIWKKLWEKLQVCCCCPHSDLYIHDNTKQMLCLTSQINKLV